MPAFTVTIEATDLTLLGAEELRVAAGLSRDDDSQDETLAEYEQEIAAEITSDCGIAIDAAHPPTLRSETCSDVFRLKSHTDALFLSRRHVTSMVTLTEDGTDLEQDVDYRLESETGRIIRLNGDDETCWSCVKVEVNYVAGFTDVPAELKSEAKARVKVKVSENSRDPLARTITTEIPDLETLTIGYQVGGLSRLTGDGLSAESERRLKRFMTHSMVG